MAEQWKEVAGHHGLHEVSDRGRVRTTADGSGGVSVGSLALLLFLAAVAVMVYKAELVNSIANGLALALCSVPCGWIGFQLCGEAKFAWQTRRYVAPPPRRVRPAITARVPLAIEAARPNPTFVIEAETRRMSR